MESRLSSFDSQLYLNTQVPLVISYLQIVAERYAHIGELFDNPEKRLFFKSFAEENLDEINSVFNKQELLEDFRKRLVYWSPQLNEISISSARMLIRDFYFKPIKKHPTWKAFISKQKELIEQQLIQKSNIEPRMRVLRDQMAGAFSFRIISAFIEANPGFLTGKLDLLVKILNVPTSINALLVGFEEKLRTSIFDELNFIVNIDDHKNLIKSLDKLQGTLLFQGLVSAPLLLWSVLDDILRTSNKSEKEKTKLRKKAADYLFDKVIANDDCTENKTLLSLISPHLDPGKKTKHGDYFSEKSKSISDPNLLKNREKTPSKESFFPPIRKLSAPPPLQSPTLLSPRSDHSEPGTPRSEGHFAVIRPSRAGIMRRRASIASLFESEITNDKKLF